MIRRDLPDLLRSRRAMQEQRGPLADGEAMKEFQDLTDLG